MDEQEQRPRGGEIEAVVVRARRRLARISGRELSKRRGAWVFGIALLSAASRPLVWPLGDEAALWEGVVRAALVLLSVWGLGLAFLVILGRRRGPKHLGAARALDEAGGHPEVVASGWAFGRGEEDGPLLALARSRAQKAVGALDMREAFPLPSLRPKRRTVAIFAPLFALALLVGAYDPVWVAALIDPPTSLETEGAAVLSEAAEALARAAEEEAEQQAQRERESGARQGRSSSSDRESMRELAERARSAAEAARRGDRERALSELGEVGRAGREQRARERALSRTLSRLSESARRGFGDDAAESLRLLARRTRESETTSAEADTERQRTLERLSRAAEAMREEAERTGSEEARRAAEELSRAAEELSHGERRAAAEALERAAREAQEMERAREASARQAEALARLMEATGLLERAVQLAMAGREGEGEGQGMAMGSGQGEGEGEGAAQGGASEGEMAALRRALAGRLAAMGEAQSGRPAPGPGGHIRDRGGESREGLEVGAGARAHSQVGEGERATQAVRGLGQNGEPTQAYRDVYPSYGAIAEEAMADESIPPLRREAVRRYFEGIRPGGGQDDEGEEQEGNEG
jgi:hypothetical protein